jgi:hypothetical protein
LFCTYCFVYSCTSINSIQELDNSFLHTFALAMQLLAKANTTNYLNYCAPSARSRCQQTRFRAITCKLTPPNGHPTLLANLHLASPDMPVAGDDLREYLIVPPTSSLPIEQSFSQNHGTTLPVIPESRPDTPRFHKSAKGKAEDINMEVEYPAPPAKLNSVHAGEDTAITAPLDGVYTLDDFLSNHQADHDAHIAAREATKAPPAKKSKTSNNSAAPQPVAVGARSSKYTILLHEKYQALAIPQPVFTYSGSSDTRWAAEVSFPGLANAEELQGLKEDGKFNSKQEAKEALSKRALGVLEELEKAGKVAKAGKTKKQQSEAIQSQSKEKEAPGENYIGQLLGT